MLALQPEMPSSQGIDSGRQQQTLFREQAESGLGLDAQRQRIRAHCELHDLRLATIFDDPGVSGGKPLAS
jgi:hypothetical protein